eukprot:3874641-Pyramimonas_sp.AAC.1
MRTVGPRHISSAATPAQAFKVGRRQWLASGLELADVKLSALFDPRSVRDPRRRHRGVNPPYVL